MSEDYYEIGGRYVGKHRKPKVIKQRSLTERLIRKALTYTAVLVIVIGILVIALGVVH